MRVGDRGGFQGGLGESRRRCGLMPEAGIGEEAGAALRVVDDRHLEQPVVRQLFAGQGGQGADDTLFEVAVVHHTQCGTGLLADPGFRRQAAAATGRPEAALEASAVTDPHLTVGADVQRLLASPSLPPRISVSGHVYDIATGRVTTTHDARYPTLVAADPAPPA